MSLASSPLAGKTVLITGAARRVGARIARLLHEAGANVVLHYRASHADAHALATELDAARAHSTLCVQADLLDTAQLPPMVDAALERFGRLDALVNNASSFFPTDMGEITEVQWVDLIGSNLKAPLFLSQAAAPALRDAGGAIVNIIDIHAERPLKGYPLYCAAKAGLLGLTRALAIELAPQVRVNGVSPGPIEWPEDGAFTPDMQRDIIDHTLLRRCGSPMDIALAVRFLLCDAPYVTGQVINIDGGRSAHL